MMLKLKYCTGGEPIFNKCQIFLGDKCLVTELPTLKRINRIDDLFCINIALRFYFHSSNGLMISQVTKRKDVGAYYHGNEDELDKASDIDIKSFQYYRYLAFDYIMSTFYYSFKALKILVSKSFILFLIFILSRQGECLIN